MKKLYSAEFEKIIKIYKQQNNPLDGIWRFLNSIGIKGPINENCEKDLFKTHKFLEQYKDTPYVLSKNILNYTGWMYNNFKEEFFIEKNLNLIFKEYFEEPEKHTKSEEINIAEKYIEEIMNGSINPLLNKETKVTFSHVLTTLFKYETKDAKNLAAYLISYRFDNFLVFDKDETNLYYCLFLETYKTITNKDVEVVVGLKNKFEQENFTDFYNQFGVIRDFYNKNDSGINKLKLVSYYYEYDISTVALDLGMKIPKLIEVLQNMHNYLDEKKNLCLDIRFFQYSCDKKIGKLHVGFNNESQLAEGFIEKLEGFVNLCREAMTQDKDIKKELMPEIWKNAEFYLQLQNNLEHKNVTKKKNKI